MTEGSVIGACAFATPGTAAAAAETAPRIRKSRRDTSMSSGPCMSRSPVVVCFAVLRATPGWRLRFERSHINGEAVLHVGPEQSLVGFVDLLDGDDFDVGSDVMFAAKVEHLLGLGDTADHRPGQTAAAHDESERRNSE